MAREDAFKVEGTIVEVLSNKTCRVELANGHWVLAFAPGRQGLLPPGSRPGAKVRLQMSAYDLSTGRIILEKETI
jgi:translation initiation factor IF-1